MNIKIINKSKINFVIGGNSNDVIKCECYYQANDIGIVAGVRDESECVQKCCDEGLYAYAYKFTNQDKKYHDDLPKKCPKQMKNTQNEVLCFLGYAFVAGTVGSLLSIFK